MEELSDSILKTLKEIYFFSNIPQYLYKNFRANIDLQKISKELSVDRINNELQNKLKEIKNLDDLIKVYAFIILLSFKNYREVRDILVNLNKVEIEWINVLADISLFFMKSESILIIGPQYLNKTMSPPEKVYTPTTSININLRRKENV